jgi:hypothetical protein
MTTDKECTEYARECVRLAALTDDQQIREQLLSMAREWMATAMHEDGPTAPGIVRRSGAQLSGCRTGDNSDQRDLPQCQRGSLVARPRS